MQVKKLEIIIGNIISDEVELPAFSRKLIMVVGNNWIEQELIIKSIIPENVIFPLLSSKSSIAFIPLGVDAFPSPSIFDDIFMAIYFWASLFFVLNKKLINGLSTFANLSDNPLLSNILIKPSQTLYIPNKFIHRETALSADDNKLDNIAFGLAKISEIADKIIIKNQIIAIFYIYSLFFNKMFLIYFSLSL